MEIKNASRSDRFILIEVTFGYPLGLNRIIPKLTTDELICSAEKRMWKYKLHETNR
jgi:hypothetical protein